MLKLSPLFSMMMMARSWIRIITLPLIFICMWHDQMVIVNLVIWMFMCGKSCLFIIFEKSSGLSVTWDAED